MGAEVSLTDIWLLSEVTNLWCAKKKFHILILKYLSILDVGNAVAYMQLQKVSYICFISYLLHFGVSIIKYTTKLWNLFQDIYRLMTERMFLDCKCPETS